MKTPRTVLTYALAPLLVLILAACGDKPLTSTQTAETFTTAIMENDTATALNLTRPEFRMFGRDLYSGMTDNFPDNATHRVELIEEAGNTARFNFIVELTPEQAAAIGINIRSDNYASFQDAITPHLSQQALHEITERKHNAGWFTIITLMDILPPEDSALHDYASTGVPAQTLQSWLTTPPVASPEAINQIEEIAAELTQHFESTDEELPRAEVDGYTLRMQAALTLLDDYVTYSTYVMHRGFRYPSIDTNKPTFAFIEPFEFHQVEGEWLFSPE